MKKLRVIFREMAVPVALVAAGVASFTIGCTRQVYVPVEKYRADTLYFAKERVDTVVDRDSVYLYIKGDTLVREVYKLRTRTRLRVDTVNHVKTDTVIVTVREPAESTVASVGKSFIGDLLNTLKWATRIAMLLLVAYLAIKLYRNFRK